jgi:arylsulfatase A-like enzyme
MFEDWDVLPGGRAENPPYATRVPPLALPWIHEKRDEGYFAYLHYLEPHAPYMPPEPYLSRLARREPDVTLGSMVSLRNMDGPQPIEIRERVIDLYDGNLAYIDNEVGALVDTLRAWGEWDRTIFVLMSDHGEAFWQHGAKGHGGVPHEELVKVPLLLRIPGFPELAGTRIHNPVELVDLMPTLVELCGAPSEGLSMVGRSWVPALVGESKDEEPRLIHMRSNRTRRPTFALRYGPWKWIYKLQKDRQHLFDLRSDPGEQRDLLAADADPPDLPVDFPALFREWMDASAGDVSGPVSEDQIDERMLESLRSLGYID